MRRKAGRPRINRTGNRGRPAKIYNMENAGTAFQECGNIAEIFLNETLNGNEAEDWKRAIQSEFEALIKNNTWVLTDRPKQRSVVGCRHILRNKFNTEGLLERRKARLVAKGYSQRPGLDFNETFSPVVRLSSIRLLMALAVEYDMVVHHLDVTTAFLNGELDEKVYMEISELLEELLPCIVKKKELKGVENEGTSKILEEIQKGNKFA